MPVPPSSPPPPPGPATDEQIAIYIAERCTELRRLAKLPRFRTVSYRLNMARLKAEKMAKDWPG